MESSSFLLELYKEENTHARHTETQRLEVNKFLLGLASAFVAFMGALKFSIFCLPFGLAIIAIGFVGLAITKTYIQRFDDHRERARALRTEIDSETAPKNVAKPIIDNHPMVKQQGTRVRSFWEMINFAVMILGVGCFLCNVPAVTARVNAEDHRKSIPECLAHQLSLS
jgi:C4-dicarboxylate transporter